MARRRLRRRVQPAKPGQQNCSFCNRVVNEEDTKYGETVRAKSFVAHYFCMMFSSGLKQVGDPDEDELRGFLENEVLQEIKRGTRLKCSFCKARGATVGCSRKKCKLGFHLPCGMERECLFQYFDDFGVWCSVHRPRQHIVPAQTPPATCLMCTDHLDPRPSNDVILTPCCRQPFHRGCLERQAATAGCHFFRCCHCKNKKDFQEEMLLCGIYIPDRDAAWEMEPNAFSDLLYEYAQCDAPRCRCPRGKTYSVNNDPRWEVIRCQACGAKGVHVACGNLSRANSGNHEWMCQDCRATLAANQQALQQRSTNEVQVHQPSGQEEIDTIIISDNEEEVQIVSESRPPRARKTALSSDDTQYIILDGSVVVIQGGRISVAR
ncbi:G2/M phase-specific E3 ubiquitin-protein ligase-like isoform X2 [Ornithodoros turicata]|uniref:G2/M phase-specific E3 ubiquitin-protein ligase-like isoform X2 n=1 Tax=Ornithodoros turicata TaxID=34597 RepID=UPI003138C76A